MYNRQKRAGLCVHVAEEMLGEVPVRKRLGVGGLDDSTVSGGGYESCVAIPAAPTCPVLSRDHFYFDFLPPGPHSCAFLLVLGTLRGQESQSGLKPRNPHETFLPCPPNGCYFLMHIYIPTPLLNLKCFCNLEVVG